MDSKEIAAEVLRFQKNAPNKHWLIREVSHAYKCDRFLWLSDNAICESSDRFDSYAFKDKRGQLTLFGRLSRYQVDDAFDAEAYLTDNK